ncbi:MAG: hypothetical protein AAGH89_04545 [Verrucomicrobiota bacterium]
MSELPEGTFQAASGKLGQSVFGSREEGEAELRFFIEIAFRPFQWDDEEQTPLLRIDGISVPVKSWRELAEKEFEFPYAPKPGSVEGAILMFGEHNPADVTRLEFGTVEGGKLRCRFETEVDFEIEADREDLEQVEMEFNLLLEVEALRVSTSLEKRCEAEPDQITAAVGKVVDLSNYEPLEKVPGGFVFPTGVAE